MKKKSAGVVQDFNVERVKYDTSLMAKLGVSESKIQELLPDPRWARERVSFKLIGTNSRIANALRRTLLSELPIKALDIDLSTIITNEKYIIRDELRDRIGNIPISQDIPDDMIFKLNHVAGDSQRPASFVFTRDLEGWDNSYMPGHIRITQLMYGNFIQLPSIGVVYGYGYENAKFTAVSRIAFRCLDYVSATIINDRGFFSNKMVKLSDVASYLPNGGRDGDRHRILIAEDKKYLDLVVEERKGSLDTYDVKIFDAIATHSSAEVHPADFSLVINTLGSIPGDTIMKVVKKNLVDRLMSVQKMIGVEIVKIPPQYADEIEITRFIISGETHTIGELIAYYIWKLDPAIQLVNKFAPHFTIRKVCVNVGHTEPLKIFGDAIGAAIADLDALAF